MSSTLLKSNTVSMLYEKVDAKNLSINIVDVSGFIDKKLEAIKAYKSQFFDPESTERSTPISSEIFLESISYRAANMGRLIFKNAGEGFTSQTPLSITDLGGLIS